jgi:hypothetical protein
VWRPSALTSVLLLTAVGLGGNTATSTIKIDKPWFAPVAWGAVVVLTAVAAWHESARARAEGANRLSGNELAAVADELAAAVWEQWHRESVRRDLHDPYPLPVGWEPADRALAPDWADLVRLATGGAGWPAEPNSSMWATSPQELATGEGGIVRVLDQVPTRRLAILGEPGAGKTMLLVRLALDLLAAGRRRPGDPVPVLLSVASWNPNLKTLHDWLAERLCADHVRLSRTVARPGGRHSESTTVARRLIDEGLIVLLLDGLDEIPASLRRAAITGINEALRPGEAFVVTCRTDDFRASAFPGSGPAAKLTGTAAIRMSPLDPAEVIDYLRTTSGDQRAASRWDPVAAALGRDATLTQVMTTPLMTTLARAIYNRRPDDDTSAPLPDPRELTELGDRVDIEWHLLDGFVRSAYRPRRTLPSRWTAEDAQHWLGFLAHHLEHDRGGEPDLAWWRLRAAWPLTGPVAVVLIGAVCAAVAGLAAGTLYGLAYEFDAGLVVGVGVTGATALVYGVVRWLTGRISAALTSALITSLVGGLAVDIAGDLSADIVSSLDVVIAAGLAVGLTLPLRDDAPSGLRAGLVAACAAWLSNLPSATLSYLYRGIVVPYVSDAVISGISIGVLVGLAVHIRRPGAKWRGYGHPVRAGAIAAAAVTVPYFAIIGSLGWFVTGFSYIVLHTITLASVVGLAVGLVVLLGRKPSGGGIARPGWTGSVAGATLAIGYGLLGYLTYPSWDVVVEGVGTGLAAGLAVAMFGRIIQVRDGDSLAIRDRTRPVGVALLLLAGAGLVVVAVSVGLAWNHIVLLVMISLAAAVGVTIIGGISRAPNGDHSVVVNSSLIGLGAGIYYSIVFLPSYGLAVGLVAGLAVELAGRLTRPHEPARSLRWSPRGVLAAAVIGVIAGFTAASEFGLFAGLSVGITVGMVVALVYGVDAPEHVRPVLSPPEILRTDRQVCLTVIGIITLVVTVAVGLIAGLGESFDRRTALASGWWYGLLAGTLIAAGRTVWPRYIVTRCKLALSGHLPWPLMDFLADAHTERGVLRLNGGAYQFRHIDLQRRLAAGFDAGSTRPDQPGDASIPDEHQALRPRA